MKGWTIGTKNEWGETEVNGDVVVWLDYKEAAAERIELNKRTGGGYVTVSVEVIPKKGAKK